MSIVECRIDENQRDDRTNLVRCPLCNKVLLDFVGGGKSIIRLKCKCCKRYILIVT